MSKIKEPAAKQPTRAIETRNTEAINGVTKLKRAFKKLKRTFPLTLNKVFDPDCVSIALKLDDLYLREVGTGIFDGGRVMPGNGQQLVYNSVAGLLHYKDSKIASTQGSRSKGTRAVRAFVMDKEGGLHLFSHGPLGNGEVGTHGAVLDEKPAEMAGLLGINKEGKICYIDNNSGHYQANALDIYRGLKVMQTKMPNVIAADCLINIDHTTIPGNNLNTYNATATNFINTMELIEGNGLPLWRNIRNRRIEKHSREEMIMKSAAQNSNIIFLDCPESGITDALTKISPKDQINLANKQWRVVLREPGRLQRPLYLKEILANIVKSNSFLARKILFDVGALKVDRARLEEAITTKIYKKIL